MTETDYDTCSEPTVDTDPTTEVVTDTEPWSYDTDGDGRVDVVEWYSADGTWQQLIDVDGDGEADALVIDLDDDGAADLVIVDNGDGTYTASRDADGDGEFETERTVSRADLDEALPGVTDLLDTMIASGTTGPTEPTEPTEPTDEGTGIAHDVDGDGRTDAVEWQFGDGTWQTVVDSDGDGTGDMLLIDTDGDGLADLQIIDNGDGTATVLQDADGDSVFESDVTVSHEELEAALPGIGELLTMQIGDIDPSGEPTGTDAPADTPAENAGSDVPVAYDTDDDGDADILQWSYPDGTWQQVVDLDADANPDVLLVDTDGDANADIAIWENGDGTYTVAQDADGDGEFEAQREMTRAELDEAIPGLSELLDTPLTGTPVGV